jgi:DNA polymerase-3 subunit alpha
VWDLCRHAWENNIWYNARGSAAGSIVAYVLEIAHVDPLQHDLLFERFLTPGRISMPDIDLDFRDDRRGRCSSTALVSMEVTKSHRSSHLAHGNQGALRDVARVSDIPLRK